MSQEILYKLRQVKDILSEHYGITKIALFGSYAKGEAKEDSDVDIVILEMKKKNGLLVARAKKFLQEYLGKDVDIGFYSSINPFIKKMIEKEMIRV